MKHLSLRYHFLRDLVAKNVLQTDYIPSSQNLADIFTKPLNSVKFQELRQHLGMITREQFDALLVEGGSWAIGTTRAVHNKNDVHARVSE